MSRINHPSKTGVAVSLPLAADRSRHPRGDAYIPPNASGPPPPTVVSSQGGVNWRDAGIGAVGGIGIAMLATGGGLVAVRMRRDHLDPATR